jgi:F-type H+-transporting ATPase subunit delta
MSQLAARKYAAAAFEVAKKLDLIDQFSADLVQFSAIFSPSLIKELSNPAISKPDLVESIADFGAKLSLNKKTIDFLKIVAQARKIAIISQISKEFLSLVKKDKNILPVTITSAVKISKNETSLVEEFLTKKYPQNSFEIDNKIDPQILGGVVLKINSSIIDASLQRQLNALNQEFLISL